MYVGTLVRLVDDVAIGSLIYPIKTGLYSIHFIYFEYEFIDSLRIRRLSFLRHQKVAL